MTQQQNSHIHGMQTVAHSLSAQPPPSQNGYPMNVQQSTLPLPYVQPQQPVSQPSRHLMPQIASNQFVASHTFNSSHLIPYNVILQHNAPQNQYYPTPMPLPLYPANGSTINNHRANANYHQFRGHVQQQQHMKPHPPPSMSNQIAGTMHSPQNKKRSHLLINGFLRHCQRTNDFNRFPSELVHLIFDLYYLIHSEWLNQNINIQIGDVNGHSDKDGYVSWKWYPHDTFRLTDIWCYDTFGMYPNETSIWRMYPKPECGGFTLRPTELYKAECHQTDYVLGICSRYAYNPWCTCLDY